MVQILCLQHATTIESTIKIFESGFILSRLEAIFRKINLGEGFTSARDSSKESIEDINLDEYPGAYVSLITTNQVGEKILFSPGYVNLVISSSLLNRKDWHFNKHDSEGFINFQNTIYHKEFLEYYLSQLETDKEIDDNEFVFHHSIPINFICKIRCKNFEDAMKLYNLAPDHLKKVFASLIQVVQTFPKEEYNCTGVLRELTPNYCFVFDDNFHYKIKGTSGRGYFAPMDYYIWLATKCGLSESEAKKSKTPEELNKRLAPLVRKRFKLVAEGKF